ncbi:MAG TPA: type I glyceraldehyde-3-phosphate dehydrogenase, partial [Bacteroidales bacterium]|nr:type I glyceraldehyde-3-phosphate dehydrogenase [Bacteroidales bacterium]
NNTFLNYAQNQLKGYLEYTTDPIVSSDITNNLNSAVFDALSTKILGSDFIQIIGWYDNESGYSARIIDLIKFLAK